MQILWNIINNIIIFQQKNKMFDRFDNETKIQQFAHEKTAAQFGQTQQDSFVHEVEAQKDYLNRLKTQREKIESLYSKYDVLLKDLKLKDVQIKQKDRTISNLETKCKTLTYASQESSLFKQQNYDIKSENQTLQKAIAELEQSYAILHGQFRSKQTVSCQKYEQMQNLNDQLMAKLRSLTKKYQQREQQFNDKYKDLSLKFQEFKLQSRKQKEANLQDNQLLRTTLLQKQEQTKILRAENQCLKQRIIQLETYINELSYENEQKIQHLQKQRKCQLRALKSQIQHLKQINCSLQRKWSKLRQESQLKQISLHEMSVIIQQQEKQNSEAMSLIKNQFGQEKASLKEQVVYYQNHIAKLERKIADMVRKEQCLYGKIKKYEVCIDAKRNLRQIEKEQMDKINLLLNLH